MRTNHGKLVICLVNSLLLAMLVSVALPTLAQAQSAAILKWSEIYTPGKKGEIIVHPSEVTRIAAGRGDIIYAIDSVFSMVYRSDNGGLTWINITRGLPGASLPASEIVVAPDSPQNVAVVTDGRTKVYSSDDSGANWSDTNVPDLAVSEKIQCITISRAYSTTAGLGHDIAIGTKDGAGNGDVYVLKTPGFGGWVPQSFSGDVMAVKFSPTYDADSTIVIVYANGGGTYLNAGKRDIDVNTTDWTAIYTSPIEVSGTLGNSPDCTEIETAGLELPSDFSGEQSTLRRIYVSTDASSGSTGIFRIDDTTVYQLMDTTGLTKRISSIAYFGTYDDGKLLAGEVNPIPPPVQAVQVWRCPGPYETSTSWFSASQPPSGPGNAQVAWSYQGRMAFCGTSRTPSYVPPFPEPPAFPDESAFSRSVDDGDTWEQTSLIDTIINISDIAPAPDSKSLFLAAYSVFGVEGVWRSAGEPLGNFWGRVLTMDTISNRLILRLSPDYNTDYTIYAIELGGDKMMVSHNRGNSWHQRYVPGPVIDLAVEDKDTIYVALPGGRIRKNTNAGGAWISPAVSCFPQSPGEINMLTVVENGHILVGSRDSRVAYSTDGGSSFTEISLPIGISYDLVGDVQVVADSNYGENGIIYAANDIADDGIWRWAIGTSIEWEQIDQPVTGLCRGQRISGLVTGDEGTLYALRSEPVDGAGAGGMTRTLNPWQLPATLVEFDIVNATLPVGTVFDPLLIFPNNLPHLKLSGDAAQNELWSVDTANGIVYRFQDNLCKVGPFTVDLGGIGCDPVSGRAQEVNLCWEQLSLADAYDIEVAKDENLSIRVVDRVAKNWCRDFFKPADVTRPCAFIPAGGQVAERAGSAIAQPGNLECGHAYYWRVRVRHAATGETMRSPWSEVRSLAVEAGLPVSAAYYGLNLLSPGNGCMGCAAESPSFSWAPYKEATRYRFVLAKDAAMAQVVVQAVVTGTAYEYNGILDYGTNHFWRVMALEPVPSDWSATFSFQTEAAELPPITPAETAPVPLWAWAVIAIGTMLAITTIVFVSRTR